MRGRPNVGHRSKKRGMRPLDDYIKVQLERYLKIIGDEMDSDAIAFVSPILPGVDLRLRDAIESMRDKHDSAVVILDTPGGVVEVVQRMVTAVRHTYPSMTVIVPDRAMSAGTIFALSANRIIMDYFSCSTMPTGGTPTAEPSTCKPCAKR